MKTTLRELTHDILVLESLILEFQEDKELQESERRKAIEDVFLQWLNSFGSFEEKLLKVAAFINYQDELFQIRKQEYRRLKQLALRAQKHSAIARYFLAKEISRSLKAKRKQKVYQGEKQ